MNTENPKTKPRRNAHSYTWELRKHVLHLKDQVTAIIEIMKMINNHEYQETLDKKLREANEKDRGRWAKKNPEEKKPKARKPKKDKKKNTNPSESGEVTPKDSGGASQNQENKSASNVQGGAARRFQF